MKKFLKRCAATTLAFSMIMSASGVSLAAEKLIGKLSFNAFAASGPAVLPFEGDWDSAMHFIVRHWHSEEASGSQFQGENEASGGRHFVVAEGYIVPDNNGAYRFCFVYQNDTADGAHKAGDMVEITNGNGLVDASEYIESINSETGKITLRSNPVINADGSYAEQFSTFSVSAGHSAVEDNGGSITITYDPYVHLVKAHAFYVCETMEVNGSQDETVFGSAGLAGDPEQDTAWVYTYVNGGTDSSGVSHKAGDIVKINGKPVKKGELDSNTYNGLAVELTKLYSTTVGLHTDKTAFATDDKRIFNIDLEAWYAEGYAPQVGMVLDASGSMAFSSDKPDVIQLTDDQIRELGITMLPGTTGQTDEPEGGWDQYFLSAAQIDKLLNKNNTDNSALSASGYSYFVYDSSSGTSEYTPLGYWEGAAVEYKDDYKFTVSDQDVRTGWPSNPHGDFNMDGSLGYHISAYDTAKNKDESTAGILLDAKPTSGNFTISFNLQKNGSDSSNINTAEIMYIGPMSGQMSDGGFYRLIRDKEGNFKRLRANSQAGRGDWLTDINDFFDTKERQSVTLVFEDGNVTSYWGDNKVGETVPFSFKNNDDINIIINGIKDDYNGAALYIDDIYVFDTALTENEIQNQNRNGWETNASLIGLYKFENNKDHPVYGNNGLNDGRTWLLNSAKSNNSINDAFAQKIENSGRATGFDIDTTVKPPKMAETKNGRTLGLLNVNSGKGTDAVNMNYMDAGWFYVTHSGNWTENYIKSDVMTGKRLVGVPGTQIGDNVFTDSIVLPDDEAFLPGGGTGYVYKPTADLPVQFYVDSNGYLRCFFNRGNTTNQDNYLCSYVYELGDSEYVKTETLQRALGAFVTQLKEASPVSEVSAVRFSTSNIPDAQLDRLVLLDWTSDPGESANIMSLSRGNGSTTGFDTSARNSINQYNYGLTGSTSTWRGLQAFKDNLLPYDGEENAPKYLIIFTDGQDTDRNSNSDKNKAKSIADELKEKGYTIFTVMLNGGPVKEGGSQYTTAHDFLLSLSGSKKTTTDTDREKYFYSVDKARRTTDIDVTGMNDADILTMIFTEDILKEITKPLEFYSVKDYIDPRFDLVDKYGTIFYLNADGNVTMIREGEEKGVTINVAENGINITLPDESDKDASEPLLRYDAEKDMYYLQWDNQTIPASTIGADRLPVWNARITVKAKDDFIGGNAVLTNGNSDHQNYVYQPQDSLSSSGTDRAIREYDENDEPIIRYPSKGFPRTTVNIPPPAKEANGYKMLYMGEYLSLDEIIKELMEYETIDDELVLTTALYWKYMQRYIDSDPDGLKYESVDDLLGLFVPGEDVTSKDFVLPYYYLPDDKNFPANQTGSKDKDNGKLHTGDCMGYLIYTWEVGDRRYPEDGFVKDTYSRKSVLTVTFVPFDVMGRIAEGDIQDAADLFATNNDYVDKGDQDNDAVDKIIKRIKAAIDAQKLTLKGADINGKSNNGGGLINESVYNWDEDYKPVVGDVVPAQHPIVDTVTRDVVSGEIVLRMDIPKDEINEMVNKGVIKPGTTIKYSAELYCKEMNKVIGTFEAEYTVDGIISADKVVYAKLTLTDDFIGTYGKNSADKGRHDDKLKYTAPTYGLPKGTYSIRNGTGTSSDDAVTLEFEDIENIPIATEADKNAFTTGNADMLDSKIYYDRDGNGNLKDPYYPDYAKFPAPAEGNTAYLGTKSKGTYTDDRYALFSVSFKGATREYPPVELPVVGGKGTDMFMNTGLWVMYLSLLLLGYKMFDSYMQRRRKNNH